MQTPQRSSSLEALRECLRGRGLLIEEPEGRHDVDLAGVTYSRVAMDPDAVGPGALFVNSLGGGRRSRRRLAAVRRREPAAILTEFRIEPLGDVPVIRVTETWRAQAAACALLHDFPGRKLRAAGITGTNGKTTTSAMLARCLHGGRAPFALVGSAIQRIGDRVAPASLTTPNAIEMQGLLDEAVAAGCAYVIVEVSSHGVLQERAAEIDFELAIITNFSTEHTDYHSTPAEYRSAKSKLFESLSAEAIAIAPDDDPVALEIARTAPCPVIRVGSDAACDVRLVGDDIVFPDAFTERLSRAPTRARLRPGTPVSHDRSNAALAATAAFALGIEADVIARSIETFPGLPRRGSIQQIGDRRVLDYMGMNPVSVLDLFSMIREHGWNESGMVVLTSPRGARGTTINAETGIHMGAALAATGVDKVIVSLALDAVGPANRPTRDELNAYLDALRGAGLAPTVTRTLRSGVRLALSAAGPDSLLVLHGAQAMEAGTAALKEALEGRAPAGWARKPQLRAEPISEQVRRSIES